jgi:hypothetical protein
MANELARIHHGGDDEFSAQIEAKRREIEDDVANSAKDIGTAMGDLVNLQSREISRLKQVIRDATIIPDRYAVTMAISSIADPKNGLQKHVLLATASDKSMWILENYSPLGRPERYRWGRVPGLPQAADEADAESKI